MLSFSTHSCCRSHLQGSQQGHQCQRPLATSSGALLCSWRGSLIQENLLPHFQEMPQAHQAPANTTLSPEPVLPGAAAPTVAAPTPIATFTPRHPTGDTPKLVVRFSTPLPHRPSRDIPGLDSSLPPHPTWTLLSLPDLPGRLHNWGPYSLSILPSGVTPKTGPLLSPLDLLWMPPHSQIWDLSLLTQSL